MKYKMIYLLSLLLFLTACHNEEPVVSPTSGSRTVLVYIVAENSLSKFAQEDIDEMKEGLVNVNTNNQNLLVYVDDYSKPRLIRLTKNKKQEVIEEIVQEYEEQNSLNSSVMQNIFSTAFRAYNAESYGIVFWSHGEGWIPASGKSRWWGQDDRKYMDIADLHKALKTAPHFDYILFDACFMESVEIAYELRNCTDYLIGSPTEIPGPGAPYQSVVPAFFDKENPALKIAQKYFKHYEGTYNKGISNSNSRWTSGASLGVVKSSELDNLAAATAYILPKYVNSQKLINTTGVMCYDQRKEKQYYHDLKQLIEKLTGGNNEYVAWKETFDKAMIYWASTPTNFSAFSNDFPVDPNSGGLSTFVPRSTKPSLVEFYHTYEWYQAAGWNQTGW